MSIVNRGRILNNLGISLLEAERAEDAVVILAESVQSQRRVMEEHPDFCPVILGDALDNLGSCMRVLGRNAEAVKVIQEAADIRRRLANESRHHCVLPDLASTLNSLGLALTADARHDLALTALEEAAHIRGELVKVHSDEYETNYVQSLVSVACVLTDMRRYERALGLFEEALIIMRKVVMSRPDTFAPDLEILLHNYADTLQAAGRGDESEQARREAMEIHGRHS